VRHQEGRTRPGEVPRPAVPLLYRRTKSIVDPQRRLVGGVAAELGDVRPAVAVEVPGGETGRGHVETGGPAVPTQDRFAEPAVGRGLHPELGLFARIALESRDVVVTV